MSGSTPSENSWKYDRIAEVDRISNLPDGVISDILSKLPIKDAVRTSVLSKDWEFKWTSIYNLHIDDEELFSDPWAEGSPYRDTVYKLLLHLNNVKSFKLTCGYYEPVAIASWISAVLSRCNIESVELFIHDNPGISFVLPRSLLGCTSLRNLAVDMGGCIFKVPAKICFPNLRELELSSILIVNELSGIDTVTFTFPVLETLRLDDCRWSKVHVEFFAPSMIRFMSSTPTDRGTDVDGYSIKIMGSRLAEFRTYGCPLQHFVLTGTTVVSAFLNCSWDYYPEVGAKTVGENGLKIRRLLRQISSSQYLELPSSVLESIVQSKIKLSLPVFSELEELHVSYDDIDINGHDGGGLLEILHASPHLELLEIHINDRNEYDYDAVESVPSCILSHLEEITFDYSYSKNPQFHLEKFLLKNAFELKYVLCRSSRKSQTKKIVQKLSAFPKGSECVTIEGSV